MIGGDLSLDDEWKSFMNGTFNDNNDSCMIEQSSDIYTDMFTDLNISTKTKIAYLNIKDINILELFWKLDVMPYNIRQNGIIKKQIKISIPLTDKDEFNKQVGEINNGSIVSVTNKRELNNKYICKLNIGLSKKDLINRPKNKGAFYNCFMLILRIKYRGYYREINAKVFNTGKLSFPGMITDELLELTTHTLLNQLNSVKYNETEICIRPNSIHTVLVNSNFNCGFYIDRDKLADILKSKYNIHVYYDSCSYPGIQCKYKIENTKDTMSFMIFRTGSILIVGKCNDETLYKIYNFIKSILVDEYSTISTKSIEMKKDKVIKKRKKRIVYISK